MNGRGSDDCQANDADAPHGRLHCRLPLPADPPERADRDLLRRGCARPVRTLEHGAGAALWGAAKPIGRVLGGLWGMVYAFLEPRLTARLGWWSGGLAFGALPLLALWFVALPLKGLPVGGGFTLSGMLVAIVLHAGFGLGVAVIIW